jgi:hypothetical protein
MIERDAVECPANTKRLQAGAAARIPDLNRLVGRRRREPCRVVREGHGPDLTAMPLERRQAGAAARIPDLNRLVGRRRREPCRVVGEGHGPDLTAMPLERRQAGTPLIPCNVTWLYRNPLWLFFFEMAPH